MGQRHGRVFFRFQFFFHVSQANPFAGRRRQDIRHNSQRLGQRHEALAEITLGKNQHFFAGFDGIDETHFHGQCPGPADCHDMVSLKNRFQTGQTLFVNLHKRAVGMTIGWARQRLPNGFRHRSRPGDHHQRILFDHCRCLLVVKIPAT